MLNNNCNDCSLVRCRLTYGHFCYNAYRLLNIFIKTIKVYTMYIKNWLPLIDMEASHSILLQILLKPFMELHQCVILQHLHVNVQLPILLLWKILIFLNHCRNQQLSIHSPLYNPFYTKICLYTYVKFSWYRKWSHTAICWMDRWRAGILDWKLRVIFYA